MRSEPILTYTGKWFYPLEPRPEDVDIRDIAHALSLICRFTGHVTYHYSVATHSIAVSELCKPHLALYGLLHDAGEAYLTDIAHPIKDGFMWHDVPFKEIEDHLICVIIDGLGIPPANKIIWDAVDHVDKAVGVAESIQLMRQQLKWGKRCRISPANYHVVRSEPEIEEQRFLRLYKELMSNVSAD